MKRLCLGLVLLAWGAWAARAAETIPPPPPAHFNDYAQVVRPATAASLDAELDQYERATSNQILVAIYPTMQSPSSVEDYTVRVAQSWHAGLKGRDNGAVLFVFLQSRRIYLQVGYGLEGALPDARCKDIIANFIGPAFHRGDYDRGLTDGVHAILAAAKGEYHGSGRTVADRPQPTSPVFFIIVLVVVVLFAFIRRRAAVYGSGGRWGSGGPTLPWIFPGGGFGGGGGGGGGGGFSGGGGSFGGGGAGGSW